MRLADLAIVDIRAQLPRAKWSIGRSAPKTSSTLHYNGPAVKGRGDRDAERTQLTSDAYWHMGAYLEADGLQYHFAIDSFGTIYQCRDLDAILWHCANFDGNKDSWSVHLMLGGDQNATDAQWQSATNLFDALQTEGNFGRDATFGHQEWKKYRKVNGALIEIPNSECPGPLLMNRLKAWRTAATVTDMPVIGVQPSITVDQFMASLKRHRAPLSDQEITRIYALCTWLEIEPAFVIALWKREGGSPLGGSPLQQQTHQPMNLKAAPGEWRRTVAYNGAHWLWSESFQTGLIRGLTHLKDEYGARGLLTVRQIIPVFAPSAENDVDGYIASVLTDMQYIKTH